MTDHRTRWSWRRRALVAGGLVSVLLAGAVGIGAIYVNSIELPGAPELQQSTVLYYSDGHTVLAQLGAEQRVSLPRTSMLEIVQQAVVVAEDPDFWTESASHLAEEAVRITYDIRDPGLLRLRVLGLRLEESYSKDQILELYLNAMPFGRAAYGIEAAARRYFDKTADRSADPKVHLTTAEAILLASLLRQPEPDPDDPIGSPGYDPIINATSLNNSKARWLEIRDALVDRGFLTRPEADGLQYPKTEPYDARPNRPTYNRPVGLVVNHVLAELVALARQHGGSEMTFKDIANGGFRVTTTVDLRLQERLEKTANPNVADSVLRGQPPTLQAAAVVVEAGTGRVLAYYGGDDGTGADYAGVYLDDTGQAVGFGAHPPGQAFAPFVLAAALTAGISLRSQWSSASPQSFGPLTVRNGGRCPGPAAPTCSLLDSTIAALDTTSFAVTRAITPRKVIEAARDAGIQSLWNARRERHPLGADLGPLIPAQFDEAAALGEYPVTVLDQANAMATFGAGGLRAQAHFVRTATRGGQPAFTESVPAASGARIFSAAVSADLNYALSRTVAGSLPSVDSGRRAGAWMYAPEEFVPSDAWIVGYTSDLAMAVWLGNRKAVQPLRDKSAQHIYGAGLPSDIFRRVMEPAPVDLGRPLPARFPPPVFGGDEHPPGAL